MSEETQRKPAAIVFAAVLQALENLWQCRIRVIRSRRPQFSSLIRTEGMQNFADVLIV